MTELPELVSPGIVIIVYSSRLSALRETSVQLEEESRRESAPLSSVFLCVHPNDSWPDTRAFTTSGSKRRKEKERERERDARSGERTSFTEPNVLKLGEKKERKKDGIVSATIKVTTSGEYWSTLANVSTISTLFAIPIFLYSNKNLFRDV